MDSRPLTLDELEAAQKEWQREVQARIIMACATPSDAPEIMDLMDNALLAVDSERRLPLLLDLMRRRPPRIFWPVFLEWWACCDDTWLWRVDLLVRLRRHHAKDPGPNYLQGDDRAFFDDLSDQVEVFRGCSRPRVRGLAWTTDRDVAARFARGHRGIPVPDAVIVRAFIPKSAVFSVCTERNEDELILDPRQLRGLTVEQAT